MRNPGAREHNMGSSGFTSGPGMRSRIQACSSVQFGARMTERSGLYLASQDVSGAQKQWLLHTRPGRFVRWQLQHMVPEVPGANVTVAYDTVLGTFGQGGWRTAADLCEWCPRSCLLL